MRSIACAFACLALLASPAYAAKSKPKPPPVAACAMPEERAMTQLRNMVAQSDHMELTVYSGERALKLVKALNSLPPETNYRAERLVVVERQGEKPMTLIVFVSHECAEHPIGVPMSAWRS